MGDTPTATWYNNELDKKIYTCPRCIMLPDNDNIYDSAVKNKGQKTEAIFLRGKNLKRGKLQFSSPVYFFLDRVEIKQETSGQRYGQADTNIRLISWIDVHSTHEGRTATMHKNRQTEISSNQSAMQGEYHDDMITMERPNMT
jgi:hypothetical protein